MEEQKETTPETPAPAAPADTPQQEPPKDGGQPAQGKKGRTVMEVTVDGKTETREVKFHTPTLLKEVEKLAEGASVKIVAENSDGTNQVLFEGPKDDAVKALSASVVKPEDIVRHFQHLVQFMADHSDLKAIGIEAVHLDKDGNDAGFGFVTTVQDCTTAQAVALVNCGDANIAEFVLKAKLDIPGRTSPAMGGIITPTAEQVKQLGK